MTIKAIQEEIVDEFSMFDDWMQRYEYIIELGKTLPLIDEQYKIDENIIKGCQSKVWVHGEEQDGKIIFTASLLTFQGGITVPGYAASKGAVGSLVKAFANEWAQHGVNVNAVAPGYIATDNTTALRNDEDRSKSILSRIPAGRWGTPEDFGGVTVFLASKAADYVHGTIITVDGGWMGR